MERSNRPAGASRLAASRLLILSVIAAALGACGPTKSTALIMDVDVQIEAARTAGAEKLAPYEYTAAVAYLHKAREEQGYSDFEVAIDFANKALDNAIKAKKKAMEAKSDGALPDVPTSPPPEEPATATDEPGPRTDELDEPGEPTL
ncbi:MAG: DUF4398 domain-containing protein [Myxococcales bacterium]